MNNNLFVKKNVENSTKVKYVRLVWINSKGKGNPEGHVVAIPVTTADGESMHYDDFLEHFQGTNQEWLIPLVDEKFESAPEVEEKISLKKLRNTPQIQIEITIELP